MRRFSLLSLSVALLVAAGATGCSDSSDDPVADDSVGLRVRPTDAENWATLTLRLPPGTCLKGNNCARPLSRGDTVPEWPVVGFKPERFGDKIRLKPGKHTILLPNQAAQTITLAPGEDRVFTFAAARLVCKKEPLPTLPQTDFGPVPYIANIDCPMYATGTPPSNLRAISFNVFARTSFQNPSACQKQIPNFSAANCTQLASYGGVVGYMPSDGSAAPCIPIDGTVDVPGSFPSGNARTVCEAFTRNDFGWAAPKVRLDDLVFPDTYTVKEDRLSRAPLTSFTLNAGDVKDVPVSLRVDGVVPAVFETNITFVDPSELPDGASPPAITSSCGAPGYKFAANALGKKTLRSFVTPGCAYTFEAGGRKTQLRQDTSNEFEIHRLDVDDVSVTREDGSVYSSRGTYEVYFNGVRTVGPTATNTGVHLLPGTYELVISYSTADGPKKTRQTVVF